MAKKNKPITKRLVIQGLMMHAVTLQVLALDPIAVLSPNDPSQGIETGFGQHGVAVSGDSIAIGAPEATSPGGGRPGAVYVFRRIGSNWVQQAKVLASTPHSGLLGFSVDMKGDVMVAGAPGWEPTACEFRPIGSAYVFERDDAGTPEDAADDFWVQQEKLIAPDFERGRALGYSVALSGNVIVVGSECGSTEVFRKEEGSWAHWQSLSGASNDRHDEFGYAVSIDAQRIVSGAPRYARPLGGSGAAYVFLRSGESWIQEGVLLPTVQDFGWFGRSLGILEGHALVGSPEYLYEGGALYTFVHESTGGWKQSSRIAAEVGNGFGTRATLDSEGALIGRAGNPWGHLYERSPNGTLELREKLFGIELGPPVLDLDGNYAVIGNLVYVIRNRLDLRDFGSYSMCVSEFAEECGRFDANGDKRVDLEDLEPFLGLFGGP